MTASYTSTSVAEDWEHGLIAGNGSLGLMLFGRPGDHHVTLSHERVVLPADPPLHAPNLSEHLGLIRGLIASGRAQAAADLAVQVSEAEGYAGLQWTDPLVPVATVDLTTAGPVEYTDYERRVDLLTGELEISWRTATGRAFLRCFVSRADGVAVLDLPTDTQAGIREPENVAIGAEGVRGGNQRRAVFAGGGDVSLTGASVELHFDAPWLRMGDDGATAEAAVLGRNATRKLVALKVTPRNDRTPVAHAGWPEGEYDELLARHAEVRQTTLPPVLVDLGGPHSHRSIEHLLSDPAVDSSKELIQLQLQSANSHIEASTGEFPPTLQGIWSGTFDPAWSSDFTMNGNVQNGALAASLSSGAPAQVRTWVDMLVSFSDDLRDNARRLFGADGYLLPSRCSISHARTTHFDGTHCHEFWTAGTPWAAAFALDEVWYTCDLERLRSVAYPFARETERFYETFLQWEGGNLLFSPSYSPENASPTFDSQACRNATQDRAALAVLLRGLIRAAELLSVDEDLLPRRLRWLEDLPPYRIAPDGTIAEWLDDDVQEEIGHRTASQLLEYWFEPGPELRSGPLAAAARTLVHRKLAWRDDGNEVMAYGLAQLGVAAAVAGDPESAWECAVRLARVYALPSLSFTHDHGSIFNLDGAGSLSSIVHSLLVQSTVENLSLVPALPVALSEGSAQAIHARGGIVVENLTWSTGEASATVRALPGSQAIRRHADVSVSVGRTAHRVPLRDGDRVTLHGNR